MTRKTITKIALVLLLSLPAGACGVKPNSVERPEGTHEHPYPRTYPTSLEQ